MANSYGRITAPVSFNDAQKTLSTGAKDEGTLCTRDNINKWARYKPERHDGIFPVVHGVYLASSRSRKGNNFGLEVPYCNEGVSTGWRLGVMNKIVYAILNNEYIGWEYLKPRGDRTHVEGGGVEEYYRITDFVRHPNERTPSADGDPTPVNLQGYDHKAEIPFTVFLDPTGVTKNQVKINNNCYWNLEINTQETTTLTFTFTNARGDNLHLEDFIDIDYYDNGICWRPVFQIFDGWISASTGLKKWWEKDQPDYEFVGDRITSNQYGEWTASLPIESFARTSTDKWHLCVGIGCCKQGENSIIWKDGKNILFLPPYEDLRVNEAPFYYSFLVVSHNGKLCTPQKFCYFYSTDRTVDFSTNTIEIPSYASGVFWLQIAIMSSKTLNYHFTSEHHPTYNVRTGYTQLLLRIKDEYNSSDTPVVLTPERGLGYAYTGDYSEAYIPADQSESKVSVYAYVPVNLDSITYDSYGYKHYLIQSSTDGGNIWVDSGTFGIHKLS